MAVIVALGLGGTGLYFGLQKKAAAKPGYTVKYGRRSNTTNSPLNLKEASNSENCEYLYDYGVTPIPLPHQLILC